MSPTRNGDAFEREFNLFFLDRVRPIVDSVTVRKNRILRRSILAGLIVFVIFGCGVYYYAKPYLETAETHGLTFWPLFILLPASMGVIGFSMVYLLGLRTVVADFRESLLKCLAEFIDPTAIYETGRSISGAELTAERLLDGLARPVCGRDRFRGGKGSVRYEISDLRAELAGDSGPNAGGKKKKTVLIGVFYRAWFARCFRDGVLIVPGFGEAGALPHPELAAKLAEAKRRLGAELYLSREGERLSIALLGENTHPDGQASLDGFDFGNMREFCRGARLCLDISRAMERDPTLWENDS